MIRLVLRAGLFVERNLATFTLLGFALILACAMTCRLVPAQTVRLSNFSGVPFDGWKRTTIDVMPPLNVGRVGDTLFVVGRQVGLATWVVDLRVTLAAGEQLAVDLSQASADPWVREPLPTDPLDWFGGIASIGGKLLVPIELQADGAGYTAQLRARVGRMFCVDLWVTWYADRPGWAHGEVIITASNPSVPDLDATVPLAFALTFGDAIVIVPGAPVPGTGLLPAGTRFADGQARAVPLTFLWLRHMVRATDWASAGAAASMGVGAVGIRQLLQDGNPSYPPAFSARAWANANFAPALQRLHTWDPSPIGPAPMSGATGGQEDQVFVRGEAMLPDGVGAELVAYAAALRMSARPCHHIEPDGAQLRIDAHPNLRIWDGRAHWHTGVSPDQLGKPRGLTVEEAGGWWGPDVEHWLFNTLAAAARLTGSPALQHLLGAQARVYLLQWTVAPGLSTSQTYAARAVGWEAIGVVHLWRELEDRAMAARVRDRWLARLDAILLPQLGAKPLDIWDVRVGDPRLGPGAWWIPWQQSVGAYGLDLAGRVFVRADAQAVALRAANRVIADAWVRDGTRWLSRAQMAVAGGGPADGSFNGFGMPLAPAVVLRHEPTNERALAIWAQVIADTANGSRSWLPPGVR